MGKKLIYAVIAIAVFGSLGFLAYRYFQNYPDSTSDFEFIPWKKPTPISVGSKTTPISPEELIENQVENALAKKHGKAPSEVRLEITEYTASDAKGTFVFVGKEAEGSWTAHKEKGGWLLTSDNY